MSDWTETERIAHTAECIEEVAYQWHQFSTAQSPLTTAAAIVGMENAVFDLRTWHPEYDEATMTLPWEREDEEPTT